MASCQAEHAADPDGSGNRQAASRDHRISRFDRHFPDIARALREVPWARRLQPRFDRREDIVATTLQHPGDFPFRTTHAIEGRVLLAIGTLGSGGAERQLVNTAEGLRLANRRRPRACKLPARRSVESVLPRAG